MPTKKTVTTATVSTKERKTKAVPVAKVSTHTTKAAVKKGVAKRITKKAPCTCKRNCIPEQAFWINNGPIVTSIAELQEALRVISDDQFMYHISREGNDFARWVRECLDDVERALRLESARTRSAAVKALRSTCCK